MTAFFSCGAADVPTTVRGIPSPKCTAFLAVTRSGPVPARPPTEKKSALSSFCSVPCPDDEGF